MNRRVPRTRTGCVSCRQRKKKCDETKPQCRACTRNKLECIWPPHIIRIFGLKCDAQDPVDGHSFGLSRISDQHHSVTRYTAPSPSTRAASIDSNVSPRNGDNHADHEEDHVAVWFPQLKSFLSPRRAGMLLPASQVLLSHYIEITGPKLAPAPDIPFISWLLPVAYSDDLLMNSILALSGGHLLYKSPDNRQVRYATYRHYSMSLLTLHRAFDDPNILLEPLVLLRVALAILILFHYEVISGNLGGSPFSHLRASRHLMLHLRRNSNRFTLTGERKVLGFVSEVYSYIVLSNSITPSDMNCNRTVVHDPFLRSLDDLRDFGAFGVMFNGVHNLFELIPHVSRLARNQGSQLSMGENLDQNNYGTRHQLMTRIEYLGTPVREQPETKVLSAHSTFLEFFRIALLAFLETTIPPISRNDSMRLHHLQPYLDLALSHLPRVVLSNYSCISMWPIMVIGSCLVRDEQRELIANVLSNNHYLMRNTAQGSDLLRLLWNDPDEYFIGPHGLGLLMQKRGLNYGVI